MEDKRKLYSQRSIAIATFFGGPVAAGYLVKKNYNALNQPENGRTAFIIGVIATILLFLGLFLLPESIIDRFPNKLIPAVYTGIIYLIVENLKKKIADNKLTLVNLEIDQLCSSDDFLNLACKSFKSCF